MIGGLRPVATPDAMRAAVTSQYSMCVPVRVCARSAVAGKVHACRPVVSRTPSLCILALHRAEITLTAFEHVRVLAAAVPRPLERRSTSWRVVLRATAVSHNNLTWNVERGTRAGWKGRGA